VFASTAIILIVIAAVGYGLYFTSSTSKTTSTASSTTSSYDTITALAFDHWGAIGDGNLTATLSQYSSSADLWWYVQGSSLNTTSGAYTGSGISSTWSKFFSNVGGHTYWTVYNYTVDFTSSTAAKVTADVWYIIGSGSSAVTLKLPYELDYNSQSGSWVLTTDWWGLPSHPGVIASGVLSPSSTTTTTSSSSTASQSSSAISSSSSSSSITTSKTTTPYGY
jgi:hypothetical protein